MRPYRRTDVAALCVHPAGPYPQLLADCYDQGRDARTFGGGKRVIAHPPCQAWCRLRGLSLGNHRDLAPFCVHQVRTWGGVLEHPAHSRLWRACELPPPGGFPDQWGGWSLKVELGWFGFPSRKPTWLYIVGRDDHPPLPAKSRPSGRLDQLNHRRRSETPLHLAHWLIDLATGCDRRAVA